MTTPPPADLHARLAGMLTRARDLGFLGPGPVTAHLDHASAWARVLGEPHGPVLDLGSGAGIPGLVFALLWPDVAVTLLDARERRIAWLEEAITELGLGDRVRVAAGRAEALARTPLRGTFGLVVARGFGTPAATAECAAGFLEIDGLLSVSEPPEAPAERWPTEGLAQLGFGPPDFVRDGSGFVILRKNRPMETRWPRRDGVPQRRPLW